MTHYVMYMIAKFMAVVGIAFFGVGIVTFDGRWFMTAAACMLPITFIFLFWSVWLWYRLNWLFVRNQPHEEIDEEYCDVCGVHYDAEDTCQQH